MRIFVINLADRADRRESVARQFAGTGLGFEFFKAIEGSGALEQHFDGRSDALYFIQLQRRSTPSEIACYASHLSLWKTCVRLNEPIVVLEDDFSATPKFAQAIEFTARHINEYGFIRLEPMEYVRKQTTATAPLKVMESGEFSLYFQTAISARATGYALNPVTAQRLIDASRKFILPVDHFLQEVWLHQSPFFVIEPSAIGLTDLADASSIDRRERMVGMRHVTRPIRRLYRVWRRRAVSKANAKLMSEYPQLFARLARGPL